MQAFYDYKPKKFESIGNGSYFYRWNIQEFTVQHELNDENITQWKCDEVIIWEPLNSNKITEKVINEIWNENYEQKLVNDFNAAKLGLYSEEVANSKIQSYQNFLQQRDEIKAIIDNDCLDFEIL